MTATLSKFIVVLNAIKPNANDTVLLVETIADSIEGSIMKFFDIGEHKHYMYSGFETANRHGFEVVPIEVEVTTV